ncbi:MAG: helix-turn-helix domain-containing protein [Bacteroidia bacterium]|nr:helix-turn-helix domain-containing protein [Bacteroidia bacterium]
MQNVIKRFITARKHLRLTQADLATSLGFKQSYISNIEKGRNEVTSNIIIAMYRLYNISPEWLITGQGNIMSSFGDPSGNNSTAPEGPPLEEGADHHDYSDPMLVESMQQTIRSQETTIQMQEKVIRMLEAEVSRLKSEQNP